ncbi:hypothetical protein IFT67_18095 [Sphingomonas sp. CFBP 13728]|uniref:hypothetical protein n=1 Tax=unclassified Sphingomonas TaxID=196159 RepID=UPI001786CB83|nr:MULTISPECIES: hypothetical protein [unclassified Sphingomonas]MBD8620832.1 hypothetical protein [Sphingomonas sp. CFBP 13728]
MREPARLIAAATLIVSSCGEPSATETANVAVVVIDGAPAAQPARLRNAARTAVADGPRFSVSAAALDNDGGLRPLPPAPMPQHTPLRAPTDSEWRLAQNDH